MRVYLSETNLVKAAILAAVVILLSVPRLVQCGEPLILYLPATFAAMLLVGGAVTAWGRSAGMPGIATDRRTLGAGAAAAAALTIVALPAQVFWLDPLLRRAMGAALAPSTAALSYPATIGGCLALLLWSAGFQTIFLQAAPMSFFIRLTGRPLVALSLCLALRVYVTHRQVLLSGMTDAIAALVALSAAATLAGCILFYRFGLAPAMLLAAGLNLHLFFTRSAGGFVIAGALPRVFGCWC